jgi:serine/threonine protein kinase
MKGSEQRMPKKFIPKSVHNKAEKVIPPLTDNSNHVPMDSIFSEIMHSFGENTQNHKGTGATHFIDSTNSLSTDSSTQYIGSYRLLNLLGHGGSSSVYLGEHRYLKRLAAIKILHTILNDQDKEHFITEAKLLAQLSHPHIVRVLEFAVARRSMLLQNKEYMEYIPYLIMDFAHSGSLRSLYPLGSRIPMATVLQYTKQIAIALQYAHDRGIIHRDVKPENILLNAQEEVMLSDFGLALFAPVPGLLSIQEMAGTLPYTAPEQLQGKPGFASDQYSLAVIVYEWLCGRQPFEGEDIDIIMQHVSSPPPPPRIWNPLIPRAMEVVILKALAKDPQQRYPKVQDFFLALEQAGQEIEKSANYAGPTQPLRKLLPADQHKTDKPNNHKLVSANENFAPVGISKEGRRRKTQSNQPQRQSEKRLTTTLGARIVLTIAVALLLFDIVGPFVARDYFKEAYAFITSMPPHQAKTQVPPEDIVDFSVGPPKIQNMTLVTNESFFQDDHSSLLPDQEIVVDFTLPGSPGPSKSKQAVVFIRGLVTRADDTQSGFAPISLYSNNQLFVQDFTLPGNGFLPNETSFQIPPGQLRYGKNEIRLTVSVKALTLFWLYRLEIKPVFP